MTFKMSKVAKFRLKQIETAIVDAQRFLKTAEDWKTKIIEMGDIYSSKEGGSCKRASMDLSRSLVPLRKSLYSSYRELYNSYSEKE